MDAAYAAQNQAAHDLLTANVTRHVSIDVLIWMEKYGRVVASGDKS
jgi:hypothetical protein